MKPHRIQAKSTTPPETTQRQTGSNPTPARQQPDASLPPGRLSIDTPPRPIQQNLPGIEFAPHQVRAHGYSEAHTWPLVSAGKVHGYLSRRVHASEAWDWSSIELRSGRAWPCLCLDCDGPAAYGRLMLAVTDRDIPLPNWIVHRDSGGAHGVWTLARPVLRGPQARAHPLHLLARASEYLAEIIQADAGYNGVLSHNPMTPDPEQRLKTDWLRREPYPLAELAEVVPFRWTRPRVPQTAIGRNCAMFEALMKWAGRAANQDLPTLPAAMAIYRETCSSYPAAAHPFPVREVEGIARSVDRYRRRWKEQGRYYSEAERRAWGRARGIRSGRARRRQTEARDRAILQDRLAGLSLRAIGSRHGLKSDNAVRHILAREAPLLAG